MTCTFSVLVYGLGLQIEIPVAQLAQQLEGKCKSIAEFPFNLSHCDGKAKKKTIRGWEQAQLPHGRLRHPRLVADRPVLSR
jgi:hypothetical protein